MLRRERKGEEEKWMGRKSAGGENKGGGGRDKDAGKNLNDLHNNLHNNHRVTKNMIHIILPSNEYIQAAC